MNADLGGSGSTTLHTTHLKRRYNKKKPDDICFANDANHKQTRKIYILKTEIPEATE
jgi:hypothetical protein